MLKFLQDRRTQVVLYLGIAVAVACPHLARLAFYSQTLLTGYYADAQISGLMDYSIRGTPISNVLRLAELQPGFSIAGGHSLTWVLFLRPFVEAMGLSVTTISLASLACHVIFVLSLWLLVRKAFPGRNLALFGLVGLGTPWYQGAIFSGTFLSLSVAMALLGLALLSWAMRGRRLWTFALAGLVLGLNFYGHVVCRPYTVMVLVVGAPLVAVLISRQQGRQRACWAALLLAAGILLALNANLLDPVRTVKVMFHDTEMITGELYNAHIAEAGMAATISQNFYKVLFKPALRHHGALLDLVLWAGWFVGAAVALRHRNPMGIVLLVCSTAVIFAISVFTTAWSFTRCGGLAPVMLPLCALGLDASCRYLARAGRRVPGLTYQARLLLPSVVLGLLVSVTLFNSVTFWKKHLQPAAIFEVAHTLLREWEDLGVVLDTGAEPERRDIFFIRLISWQMRRDRDLDLDCPTGMPRQVMDRFFREHPQRTALVRYHTGVPPRMPSTPVKPWRTFHKKITVFQAAVRE